MITELELKAVVPDPAAFAARLDTEGAVRGFRGRMEDRRFDRAGELTARDEVLRVRRYLGDHESRGILAWKGPTRVVDGLKARDEVELPLAAGGADPTRLLTALGYVVTHAIDRFVEYRTLEAVTLRLEWYPRLDVLVEVEGEAAALERVLARTGLPRAAFTPEPLAAFAARYEARMGRPAVLSLAELVGETPAWPA